MDVHVSAEIVGGRQADVVWPFSHGDDSDRHKIVVHRMFLPGIAGEWTCSHEHMNRGQSS